MSQTTASLEELVKELRPEEQGTVREFVEFLLHKRQTQTKPGVFLRQSWAGGLAQHRHDYSSVELQHTALNWRSE